MHPTRQATTSNMTALGLTESTCDPPVSSENTVISLEPSTRLMRDLATLDASK